MKFRVAAVYDNYISANIAMGLLQNENINCWLKDENTVTIDPILTNAVGGIKLMVPEVQLDRAFSILDKTKQSFNKQHPCPQCGSNNIEYVSTPKKASNLWGTIISALFLGAPTPIDKLYHCFNCGNEFEIQ
ncbi:MAG: DUF2007 domain-containing protein [Niabella sp.]